MRWDSAETSRPGNRGVSGVVAGGNPPGNAYAVLMSVDVQHGYHNGSAGLRCDATFAPTSSTASLMQDLGLLFRRRGTGFDVACPARRIVDLGLFLARERSGAPGTGIPASLKFTMTTRNPYFIGMSDLPWDTHPVQQRFYFTNARLRRPGAGRPGTPSNRGRKSSVSKAESRGARDSDRAADSLGEIEARDGASRLHEGPSVGRRDLVEVVDPVFEVPCDRGGSGVEVSDGVGNVTGLFDATGQGPTTVNLGRTAEGFHAIRIVDRRGKAVGDPRPVIVGAGGEPGLGWIELYLARPGERMEGAFPLNLGADGNSVEWAGRARRYSLTFEARSTYWSYWVLPRPKVEPLENLEVVSMTTEVIPFSAPRRVPMGDGRSALVLTSGERLPLRERSPYQFRLRGTYGPLRREGVLVDRLPVPGPSDVGPGRSSAGAVGGPGGDDGETCYSDLYISV